MTKKLIPYARIGGPFVAQNLWDKYDAWKCGGLAVDLQWIGAKQKLKRFLRVTVKQIITLIYT